MAQKKTVGISFAGTRDEKKQLEEAAKKLGVSRSEYIRSRIYSTKPHPNPASVLSLGGGGDIPATETTDQGKLVPWSVTDYETENTERYPAVAPIGTFNRTGTWVRWWDDEGIMFESVAHKRPNRWYDSKGKAYETDYRYIHEDLIIQKA